MAAVVNGEVIRDLAERERPDETMGEHNGLPVPSLPVAVTPRREEPRPTGVVIERPSDALDEVVIERLHQMGQSKPMIPGRKPTERSAVEAQRNGSSSSAAT